MTFSTGRGGAGNMKYSKNITSENNHIKPVASNHGSHQNPNGQRNDQQIPQQSTSEHNSIDNKGERVYYSTGRGGAGNIQSSKSLPSPKLVPQGSNTPQLHTNKISTGRGGYGNMLKNDDPELTRKVQDVDGPSNTSRENDLYAVASNKSFSIGRGGFGNVMSNQRSGNSQSSQEKPALMAISSYGETLKDEPSKKSFFGKLKGLFTSD